MGSNGIKSTSVVLPEEWIQDISAGSGSKTEVELDQLGKHVQKFIDEFLKDPKYNSLLTWNLIAESAQDSNMLFDLISRIIPQSFFKLGNVLANLFESNFDKTVLTKATHLYLNLFRQSSFLKKINLEKQWEHLVYQLILKSNFNLAFLFKQRLDEYGRKTLFKVIDTNNITEFNWIDVDAEVTRLKKGLIKLALQKERPSKVAFLMENSLTMACLDLACLTAGIVNVMIPANSVPQHIEFILNQSHAQILLVSSDKQLAKVKSIKKKLPYLEKVVLISGSSIEEWVMSLGKLISTGNDITDEQLTEFEKKITIEGLATLMYTSGTTGDPKGIMFSQMNLVYKRFCRAMALPEIGFNDRFLSFLPLFHTFGRYLEMLGSIFWGAEYAFMENPAMETMLDNMKRLKPTIFISIPKKWYELYNHVAAKVDLEFDDPAIIKKEVEKASGGHLKWGLSAAGFLEPDVFRFFQQNGIELMSGFGMTEATGGITMTPPGEYIENSLGRPLPGIEVKLAEDGEMLIRGPYVMISYYEGDDNVQANLDFWLPTGDIMTQDSNGFYEIIDRKKEIYKNIKGETIAPQKIENYFRDFEYAKQVFLVGDHRQFNTVLIYPDQENVKLKEMSLEEKQNLFSTIVVTVNKFLAPFERIVDFHLIERPFSEQMGELTPKGTYKRRVIEKNFDDIISTMYSKNYISLSWQGREVRIPNWFLREKGCLIRDIVIRENDIYIPKYKQSLKLKEYKLDKKKIIIGNFIYDNSKDYIDFQIILNNPLYWLGNYAIVNFTGDAIYQWYRIDTTDTRMLFNSIQKYLVLPLKIKQKFESIAEGEEYSLEGLHYAVMLLQTSSLTLQQQAAEYLNFILEDPSLPLFNLAKNIIARSNLVKKTEARRLLYTIGLTHYKGIEFEYFLQNFIEADKHLLDQFAIAQTVKKAKGDENLNAIYKVLKTEINKLKEHILPDASFIPSLFELLAEYGIHHPTRYKLVRQFIVRYQLTEHIPELSLTARNARLKLLGGFRHWLGENQPVAVDVETGDEYEWAEVMIFDEEINDSDRDTILAVISESSLVREAIFLLSNGSMIRLYDIPPGGMWISQIDKGERMSFFRVSVQTRFQGAYDFVLCINHKDSPEKMRKEINWLIHSSRIKAGENLVDNFGGYWQAYGCWTKEYFPGSSIETFIRRNIHKSDKETERRVYYLWPFFVWSAAWAHIQFWRRTNYTMELKNKTADNIIIPSHDYQTGIKIISIEHRIKSKNIKHLLQSFYNDFVAKTEKMYPGLKQGPMWHYIYSALINSENEQRGLTLIREIVNVEEKDEEIKKEAKNFLDNFEENGYLPKKLFFAIRRFERWRILNEDASLSAQARTLNELYDTYYLVELDRLYPETRTNFFLHTVFADSKKALKKALLEIVKKQHFEQYSLEETLTLLSNLQKEFELSEKESFFLARLSYPHLKPTDAAEFISLQSGGEQKADVVIRLEDYDGHSYLVRKPVSPKEISHLHQIFMDAQLPVNFRPEHQFMVAISERGHIIGGLFYTAIDAETVYMEKIVVSNRYRRKGISEGLMEEFSNRMRGEHFSYITTGFFRPEYFYRFGFKVERKYSGLVKDLAKEENS